MENIHTLNNPGTSIGPPPKITFLGLTFDILNEDEVLDFLARREEREAFDYLVTPNVQHVVLADSDPRRKAALNSGELCICDSQPIRMLGHLLGYRLPLVTGADLSASLFRRVIQPGDRIAAVCASERIRDGLSKKFPTLTWSFFVPPAGTEPGTTAFDECVDFIATSDARFTFVALGAPKSELMCHTVAQRNNASGMALCTGAALEFIIGDKTRAPKFIRKLGLEWSHRIATEPKRLWYRYASAVWPLMILWLRELKISR